MTGRMTIEYDSACEADKYIETPSGRVQRVIKIKDVKYVIDIRDFVFHALMNYPDEVYAAINIHEGKSK